MDEKAIMYKEEGLMLCNRLINELESNIDDARRFFGGELNKAYVQANDKALEQARSIRNRLRSIQ